jgi:dynein heavy chain 1
MWLQKLTVTRRDGMAAHATWDDSSTVSEFGPIHVKYNKVQSQVNLKYDSWQKDLETCFAAVLAERINESYGMISNINAWLESMSLDGSSTSTREIVIGVNFLQEITHQLSTYQEGMNEILESEKILKMQRHAFRGDWVESSIWWTCPTS